MKFVIVGLGSIGRRHLKNLIALGEKDIILCRSKLSTLPDEELKDFPVVTSIHEALKLKPDAVIISNPTALHLDVAIPAAEAGCHILLEKPLSHSMERIEELRSALKKGGGQLLVGFQFRFHPTLQIAAQLISQKVIGRPVSVRAHWGECLANWHPWEDFKKSYAARKDLGGGVVLTLCHPFDYLNWLLGKPELLWAKTDTIGDLGVDVEDIADVCLRFPGGALGTVHLDYLQQPASHHLEIIGTKGTMIWNNSTGQLAVFRSENNAWKNHPVPADFERNSLFLEEMKHFLAVVRGETKPVCTLEDGITAQEIAGQVRGRR
ncbi:hypothetical protein A2291_07335 [candidate division WOR-1 bacterium RIFOXYB2_FULL_42_35]|uniref:Gfo/Idh/MocA-like oxidoreductase N-terminal domain-containing protein n=1 Tax=candidate division WOR-1 bacterium RIFOXYC2_FULL_41_25 TaxID=1802586 RepID=A0A1F4TKK1_UNCSA|nr:MAG: hypothetical protein A2291_07335 [candidate division WOR-1 bacterium RIFOXYB2_FULL_42_35]OGC25585.1 MAG: hypothetical protein A2247_01555 [candidate division WOR-1 bacterium RIFOXYA2_FULL_41_14]OGC33255.1 MAG: hypothetical protein A2462_07510 [candidate division WOR-1 bacterium RIFOXYC2_FULL_41_25]OGC41370.1 MAG: hypothetical protein A2548_02480 [candidate division WOR-1 bacterium RIFOXYD2_FULL_41_8]